MGDVSMEGYLTQPNIGIMDENAASSDTAKMARQKSQDIMQALRSGEPGAADKMLGKSEPKGTDGMFPLEWLKGSFRRSKKDKKNKKDDTSIANPPPEATHRIKGGRNKAGVSDDIDERETGSSGMFVSATKFSRSMKVKEDDKVIR